MKICKECKNFDGDVMCIRGRRPAGRNPVSGRQEYKYTTIEYAFRERESILPWKCGKKGRHFESKEQK